MGLYGALRTSTSGMAAQANRLSTVADNIANSSTTGYKRSQIEFATLVLESGISEYQSGAVESNTRRLITEQGGLAFTTSDTDLAIQGDGFFIVEDASGQTFLTRAGSFVANADGNLVNAGGYRLVGLDITNGGASTVVNGTAGLNAIDLATLGLQASPTTLGTMAVNLNSNSAIVTGDTPADNLVTSTFTSKSSLVTFDNLGNEVTIDVYFTKTATNAWEATVFNKASASAGGGFPYSTAALTTTTLTFNPANGQLAAASPDELNIPIPGGATLTLDISQATQLATQYTVRGANVNGNAASDVERFDISEDGILSAVYKNGARLDAYRIPLATTTAPNNMRAVTGNAYLPTGESGDLTVGFPTAGGMGSISANALEQSTVDLATELTTMIESQRSYQANSRVFQTSAELLNVLVNLQG